MVPSSSRFRELIHAPTVKTSDPRLIGLSMIQPAKKKPRKRVRLKPVEKEEKKEEQMPDDEVPGHDVGIELWLEPIKLDHSKIKKKYASRQKSKSESDGSYTAGSRLRGF